MSSTRALSPFAVLGHDVHPSTTTSHSSSSPNTPTPTPETKASIYAALAALDERQASISAALNAFPPSSSLLSPLHLLLLTELAEPRHQHRLGRRKRADLRTSAHRTPLNSGRGRKASLFEELQAIWNARLEVRKRACREDVMVDAYHGVHEEEGGGTLFD